MSGNHKHPFGEVTQPLYDESKYRDNLRESVDPFSYRMDPTQIRNCSGCLSTYGPRGKFGVSTPQAPYVAHSQQSPLVDIESKLFGRNGFGDNFKNGMEEINMVPTPMCGDYLNQHCSRLTLPPSSYRGVSINRFYDLNQNPQKNIFWNFERDTRLEAKDSHVERYPIIQGRDPTLPIAKNKGPRKCTYNCTQQKK
jgi:hypothetical protein